MGSKQSGENTKLFKARRFLILLRIKGIKRRNQRCQ